VGPGHLTAVADAGPLIHLAEIDSLSLLGIFAELHIPEGVWYELARPPTIRAELTFAKRHAFEREEVARFTADQGLGKLQAGERESLLLCTRLAVPVLLTDDLAVRHAAKALGLTPVGSLGIVARAHRMGRLSGDTAERLLRQLATVSSLYVTPTIVDLAIERLRAEGSSDRG
jgi:predicted nucleic acid-binding protein